MKFEKLTIPDNKLKIAIAQVNPEDANIDANINKVIVYIEKAIKNKANLIVFPEKFITGYIPEKLEEDLENYTFTKEDTRFHKICKLCKKGSIVAIIGVPTRKNNQYFISSIVIGKEGKIINVYNKTHLFSSEKNRFSSDKNLSILNVNGWRIGLGICYDIAFAEHSRILAQNNCHAYIVSALFSKGGGYLESRIWFPARALDNTIYTVLCNYTGTTGKWDTCGKSGVWSPLGQLIIEASENEEEILFQFLDPKMLRDAREIENMLADSTDVENTKYNITEVFN